MGRLQDFPAYAERTVIEPSYELSSKAAIKSPGAKIVNGGFEDFHIINKFDGVVMNPPLAWVGKRPWPICKSDAPFGNWAGSGVIA